MSVSSCLSKGSQSAGQVESMQSIQNSAGANFGGANPQGLELAQNGMEQQQSMSFKKVKFILNSFISFRKWLLQSFYSKFYQEGKLLVWTNYIIMF